MSNRDAKGNRVYVPGSRLKTQHRKSGADGGEPTVPFRVFARQEARAGKGEAQDWLKGKGLTWG